MFSNTCFLYDSINSYKFFELLNKTLFAISARSVSPFFIFEIFKSRLLIPF